jgi:hypothetical protein
MITTRVAGGIGFRLMRHQELAAVSGNGHLLRLMFGNGRVSLSRKAFGRCGLTPEK